MLEQTKQNRNSYRSSDEHCSCERCDAKTRGHSCGRIKSNWFFLKDDQQFYPEHTHE